MSQLEISHLKMSHLEMSHLEMSHLEMLHLEMSHLEMSGSKILCDNSTNRHYKRHWHIDGSEECDYLENFLPTSFKPFCIGKW